MNMSKKRVLLVNPSYRETIYREAKIKAAVNNNPNLTLATVAAPLIKAGHEVRILDMNLPSATDENLAEILADYKPDFTGITFTTALFEQMKKLTSVIRSVDNNTVLIGGGVHASSMPEETLRESLLDVIILGEGDYSVVELVESQDWSKIGGIGFKKEGNVIINQRRDYIKELDSLPFPAWHLYDIKDYKSSSLINRASPAANIETSRGCVFECVYCNKSIFGRTFRKKSVNRVVDEMEYMLSLGIREINILDDCFTTDRKRAAAICDEIVRRKLKFLWNTQNGIRVDTVDRELFKKFREAGCYQVTFGIESGNQQILDNCKKGTNLKQVEDAVKWAKEAGLEVMGYFMFGLPGETEKTMRDTINFAKALDLDYAKVSITIPLPGTPYYGDLKEKGYMKTQNWEKFNFYTLPKEIYDHPTLDWETINSYNDKFYREFYFRPGFIAKRLFRDIKNGLLLEDIKAFLQTRW